MTGWRLAAVLALAFGGGYVLRSWVCLIRCQEIQIRLARRALIAEANVDHALCKVTENAMANYIAHQEARLDTLEPSTLEEIEAVAEAERITREGS